MKVDCPSKSAARGDPIPPRRPSRVSVTRDMPVMMATEHSAGADRSLPHLGPSRHVTVPCYPSLSDRPVRRSPSAGTRFPRAR